MTLEEQNAMSNSKLLQYLNEMLSVENAAVERLHSRIQESSLEEVKEQLQYHLQETMSQQQRLINLIKNRGGINPTSAKADLPFLKPKTETTFKVDEMISTSTIIEKEEKETLKSIVNETENVMMKAEKELIESKQDAIIENAEIISYKMLIEIARKINANDAIPILEENLKEEESMSAWIIAKTRTALDRLWPYIEASAGTRPLNA